MPTLFEKIWSEHAVAELPGGMALLQIDRHLIHDLVAGPALANLARRGARVRNPELTFATVDHAIASSPDRAAQMGTAGARLLQDMRRLTAESGIQLFDLGSAGQGIVHVMAPELGISLPGTTIVCGDSHTCTNGALGALAFGIGSSEVEHVLATQTLRQRQPATMRVRFEGTLQAGVTAKDMILHTIGKIGTAAGQGYAVEYAGSAIRALGMEERFTICNLSIELGAKIGLIAPDDTTFEYVHGREFAPQGASFDAAVAHWRTLPSDADATFARDHEIHVEDIAPQITWGTSPEDVISITAKIPDPSAEPDAGKRKRLEAALLYMGLRPGDSIEGTPVDWVFIGSCANSRLSDLRAAANIVKGRKVAPNVQAWVVPGSESVKRAAASEGLDRIFLEAGFQWREPSCSLCLSANGEVIEPGQRSVSTTNRNFVGRQGRGVRTHLASPVMAAAAALTGKISDVRRLAG